MIRYVLRIFLIFSFLEAFFGVSGIYFFELDTAYADSGSEGSDGDHDQDSSSGDSGHDSRNKLDEIRDGVKGRKLLPLWAVKAIVEKKYGSNIIDVQIEKEKGRWVYEFKIVNNAGHLIKVYVNAQTGAIIEVKND